MKSIDLNADIGEALTPDGQKAEAQILQYVSSANIACGGHAGDDDTMHRTVRAALHNNAVIGAHPGYPDPQNFGRKSMDLTDPILAKLLKQSLTEQIIRLAEIAASEGVEIRYVKPHGALYNDAVKSRVHADLISEVISGISSELIFMGGPNSEMGKAARKYGLQFVAEGFIDRRYTDDGHLQNRAIEGAVLNSQTERMEQARSLARVGEVKTATGKILNLDVRSLCLHGDSIGAVETARKARSEIEGVGCVIKAFADV